jgi:hypothetical protein
VTIGASLSKIESATFEPLNNLWAKDGVAVYTATGKPVAGADLKTFRVCDAGLDEQTFMTPGPMPQGYAADRSNVWFHNATYPSAWRLKNANPSSFSSLGFGYGSDRTSIYHEQRRIRGADPRAFRLYGRSGYAADQSTVYYDGMPIEGADPFSFVLVWSSFMYAARDRNRYYLGGQAKSAGEYLTFLKTEVDGLREHMREVASGAYEEHFQQCLPVFR